MAGHSDRCSYNRPDGPRMRPPPWQLNTFRDALGVTLELSGYYSEATIAFLIAADGGRVKHFGVEAGESCNSALLGLAWALSCAAGADDECCRAEGDLRSLLITIDCERPILLGDEDVGLFRWADRALSSAGAPLDDWIYTDGEMVRSVSFASNPRAAWPSDAVHHRLIDQARWFCEP